MPEGHTLHRIARDHSKWFVGQKMVVLSPQGRFSSEAEELTGRKLSATEAFGKHLVYRFSGGKIMHVHLGLYGKFRVHRNAPPEPRGAVRVRMIGAERTFDLNGPNRCELLSGNQLHALLDRLGPDPLREDADAEKAWARIKKSRAAIGTLLLDQSVLAGIGNIYRAEVLFALGIHPNRLGKDVNRNEFDDIWDLISRWLQIGVKHNRIITVDRESVDVPLSRLPAKERIQIYKRKSCPRCGGQVDAWGACHSKNLCVLPVPTVIRNLLTMPHKKLNLPTKKCARCGMEMVWRKKWERSWEQVRYCSERCRKKLKRKRLK